MKSRWRWLVLSPVLLLVLSASLLWLRDRSDPRLEAILDHSRPDAAIDDEVVLAELPLLDERAFRKLLREPLRPDGFLADTEMWLRGHLPASFQDMLPKANARRHERRQKALRILALLGADARPYASQIEVLATNQDFFMANDANVALVLIQGAGPESVTNLVRRMSATNPSALVHVAARCAQVGTNSPPVLLPILIDALDAKSGNDRLTAARAIARYGSQANSAAQQLRRHLGDSAKNVRPSMAFALGSVAPEFADEAVAAMLEQQRTNNSWTGDYAHQLYARLGPAAHAAVPSLETELANPVHKMSHGAAAVALWRIRHEVTPVMVEALAWDIEHGVQRSQRWSLQALAEIGPPATNAVPALRRMTKHPRVLFRQMAEDALQAITKPSSPAH